MSGNNVCCLLNFEITVICLKGSEFKQALTRISLKKIGYTQLRLMKHLLLCALGFGIGFFDLSVSVVFVPIPKQTQQKFLFEGQVILVIRHKNL